MNPPKYISYDNVDLDEPNNLKYPIPDKLYKYTRIHNAKDLLYDNIIYLPEITELNDPYEGHIFVNISLLSKTVIDQLMDTDETINEDLSDEIIEK